MAWQLWLILEGVKWCSERYSELIRSIRAFQELYATSGMGLFVNVGAETHNGRSINMAMIDRGLKAQLLTAPFPLIYNLYWEEIRDTPFLAAYFEQFPSWKQYMYVREDLRVWEEWVTLIPSFVFKWASVFGGLLSFNPFTNLMKTPYLFVTPIKAAFVERLLFYGGVPLAACDNIIAKFSSDMHSAPPIFLSKSLAKSMHPLIGLEWGVMKAGIMTLYVYNVLLSRHPGGWDGRNLPAPFIPGQRFRILDKGNMLFEVPLTNSGILSLPLKPWVSYAETATEEDIADYMGKYPAKYIHVYQLDSHGITSEAIVAMGIGDVIVHPTGDIPTEGGGVETNADTYVTIAEREITLGKRYQLAKVVVPCDNAHKLQIVVAGTVRKRYNARKEDTFIMFYLYNEVTLEGAANKKVQLKAKAVETGETLYGNFYGEEEEIGE